MPTPITGCLLRRALVVAVALCLFASSAQAARLTVDPNQSFLAISGNIDASSVGGPSYANLPYLEQATGSMTATYAGWVDIDLQPGTIQLLPGSNMVAATTGIWAPADPGPGNGDPSGGASPANYGISIPQLGVLAEYNTLRLDFGALAYSIPSTPMALSGPSFDLTGQAMSFSTGRSALVSGLGNDASDVSGFPTIFSTNGADVGTWDGTTLTIPVHSTVTYEISSSPLIYNTVQFTGQIVAVIPEPSTMIMAGLGVFGLVAVGYRKRKA